MKRRILFVDDEPKVLQGLRRMLRAVRRDWEMEFAEGGQQALEALARSPFDVVVSDMRMPGMDGAQLLTEVKERHPEIVRIVLSGQSDEETILRAIGPTHQYLSKPCDAERLKSTVTRACTLRDLLPKADLKRLISQLTALPSLPSSHQKLVDELSSPEPSIRTLGDIISRDVGMAAKALHLVSSAFFGVYSHITSPEQAVSTLGVKTIRTLVLDREIFSRFDPECVEGLPIEAMMSHCNRTGDFAKLIAQAEGQERNTVHEARLAGLLHDAGMLVLAACIPEQYKEAVAVAQERRTALWEAEQEMLGATHAEAGAYLLGLWGLADPIVEAVAFHHRPAERLGGEFTPLSAVHAAEVVEHLEHPGATLGSTPQVARDYLHALGLADRLPAWQEVCRRAELQGVAL